MVACEQIAEPWVHRAFRPGRAEGRHILRRDDSAVSFRPVRFAGTSGLLVMIAEDALSLCSE